MQGRLRRWAARANGHVYLVEVDGLHPESSGRRSAGVHDGLRCRPPRHRRELGGYDGLSPASFPATCTSISHQLAEERFTFAPEPAAHVQVDAQRAQRRGHEGRGRSPVALCCVEKVEARVAGGGEGGLNPRRCRPVRGGPLDAADSEARDVEAADANAVTEGGAAPGHVADVGCRALRCDDEQRPDASLSADHEEDWTSAPAAKLAEGTTPQTRQ